jgi:hypothetical protein
LGDEGLVERLVELGGVLLDQGLQIPKHEVSQSQDHQPHRHPARTPPHGISQEQSEHEGGEQTSEGRGCLLPAHRFVRDQHREALPPDNRFVAAHTTTKAASTAATSTLP